MRTSTSVVSACPPSIEINQLMCTEVPESEPIVKFIDLLNPLKMPGGQTVAKSIGRIRLQVALSIMVYI